MNLCIFLPSGKTFSFKDVVTFISNEAVLDFDYAAMSDGKTKRGVFLKANIAGWSTHD